MAGLRKKILLLLSASAVVILAIGFGVVQYTHTSLINLQALRVAEIVATQVITDRAIYTGKVVGKLVNDGTGAAQDSDSKLGYIPLPAQFVRQVSLRVAASQSGLYKYNLISEWNLNPSQSLNTDFDRWAWKQLKAQEAEFKSRGLKPDAANGYAWKPLYRFEKVEDERVLRYLAADPASAAACVNCHNTYEQAPNIVAYRESNAVTPGKQFQMHDLMGALSVTVPVKEIDAQAAGGRNLMLLAIGGLFVAVMGIMAFVLTRSAVKPLETSINELGKLSGKINEVAGGVMSANTDMVHGAEQQFETVQKLSFLRELHTSDPQLQRVLNTAHVTLQRTEELADQNASRAEESAMACKALEECVTQIGNTSGALLKIIGRNSKP